MACGKRAGSRVAMCGLTSVGAPEIPSVLANTRRSWSHSVRMSFWPAATTPSWRRSTPAFARTHNCGSIGTGGARARIHSALTVAAAAHHTPRAAYSARFVVAAGGLIPCGPDFPDVHRRPAAYIDRILKGEKPADLP